MPSLRARWSVVCLAVCDLLSSLPTLLSAQGTSGRILGRVADPSGAVLAGVKVTLVNEGDQREPRRARPTTNGDYDFVEVPVGTYRLEFDLTGFKKNVRRECGPRHQPGHHAEHDHAGGRQRRKSST